MGSERRQREMTTMVPVTKVRQKDIPGLELAKGMSTQYNVCQETVGSKFLKMGVCTHAPDMADLKWTANAEEAFYIAKGSIKVIWRSDGGEGGETVVREGEQVFLPKGYHYILRATGEPAINVFAVAGDPPDIESIHGAEAAGQLKTAAAQLRNA
ncbi:MAG: hypothetical protein DMD79_16090 [Candidatus Rokuibacteriota bacterium]|nr:MAG: hypothetical protein DMD79_16090 [Candidatus Rokubacteria bacterium]